MKLYGLIGNPLTHSFSEIYFKEKFKKENISDSDFKLFPLTDINELFDLIGENTDLQGFSVTIPFKEQIIPYLNEIDEVAKKIGAVNSVKIIRENNKFHLKGYNTDIVGFKSILDLFSVDFTKVKALVLGSGGASKAVTYVLHEMHIPYQVVSRNPDKNQISYNDIAGNKIDNFKLIINTTPLGMFPDINTCPAISYDKLSSSHYLIDLTYNPEKTLFLKNAEKRGSFIANGKLMLETQADVSWAIWVS